MLASCCNFRGSCAGNSPSKKEARAHSSFLLLLSTHAFFTTEHAVDKGGTRARARPHLHQARGLLVSFVCTSSPLMSVPANAHLHTHRNARLVMQHIVERMFCKHVSLPYFLTEPDLDKIMRLCCKPAEEQQAEAVTWVETLLKEYGARHSAVCGGHLLDTVLTHNILLALA